jgi:hypothetical protein
MYTITRQRQWPEGKPVVEISYGGIDYCNPDALVEKYPHLGEFKEFKDPRKAAQASIAICKAWRKDGEKKAKIGIGSTGGMTMPFETCSFKQAEKWADMEYKAIPKCPQCAKIMEKNQEKWSAGFITQGGEFMPDEKYIYCSEYCAEKNFTR